MNNNSNDNYEQLTEVLDESELEYNSLNSNKSTNNVILDDMPKKKFPTQLLGLVFLLLAICFIGVFLMSNKSEFNGDKNKNDSDIPQAIIDDKNENSEQDKTSVENIDSKPELKITDEIVVQAYNNIPVIDGYTTLKNVYQNIKIDEDTVDNKILLAFAFTKTTFNKDNTYVIPGYDKKYVENSVMNGWFAFDSDVIQDTAKKLYGRQVFNETVEIYTDEKITFENRFYKYTFGTTGDVSVNNIRNIEKAYEDEEFMYIEDTYIALVTDISKKSAALYAYSGIQEKVLDLDYKEYVDLNMVEEQLKITSKYKDNMKKFKHTFKKDSEGNYCWVSTEPII